MCGGVRGSGCIPKAEGIGGRALRIPHPPVPPYGGLQAAPLLTLSPFSLWIACPPPPPHLMAMVTAPLSRATEPHVRPTRPPVSSPSVAANLNGDGGMTGGGGVSHCCISPRQLSQCHCTKPVLPGHMGLPNDVRGLPTCGPGRPEGCCIALPCPPCRTGPVCAYVRGELGVSQTDTPPPAWMLRARQVWTQQQVHKCGLNEQICQVCSGCELTSRFTLGTRTCVKRMAPLSTPLSPTCALPTGEGIHLIRAGVDRQL